MTMTGQSSGWAVVVFEDDGQVAYVRGPFDDYQDALDWADCLGTGDYQLAHLEPNPHP